MPNKYISWGVNMIHDKLIKQIEFIIEIDKLKSIFRQTVLKSGEGRRENDAEHSWHLAIMAVLLSEYANEKDIDVLHVVKMVLIHDIVEIDAGDTYCYDEKGNMDKLERELKAADRIFNILPEGQAKELRALWDEFEERVTIEARFAAALDRLQPVLLNYAADGISWRNHDIHKDQVIKRNKPIEDGSKALWEYAAGIISDAVENGYLYE